MEGRAARRRLPALVLGRADGVRGGRRGDRGQRRHARRRPRRYPDARPGAGARRPQRHRHRAVPAPTRAPTCVDRLRRRPGPAVRAVRRPDHPAEGRRRTCSPRRRRSTRTCRSCCARASPDTPEIGARRAPPSRSCRPRGDGVRLGRGDAAAAGPGPAAHARDRRSSARRSTSRSASSTSRRWPASTAVVASDVGGIPEVVVDGETGLLVHYDEAEPAAFEAGLAAAVNAVVADRPRGRRWARPGGAGRARVRLARDRRRRPSRSTAPPSPSAPSSHPADSAERWSVGQVAAGQAARGAGIPFGGAARSSHTGFATPTTAPVPSSTCVRTNEDACVLGRDRRPGPRTGRRRRQLRHHRRTGRHVVRPGVVDRPLDHLERGRRRRSASPRSAAAGRRPWTPTPSPSGTRRRPSGPGCRGTSPAARTRPARPPGTPAGRPRPRAVRPHGGEEVVDDARASPGRSGRRWRRCR